MSANTPKSKYRRWTTKEDSLLTKLYQSKTLYQLAKIFDRGWNKIGRRAMRLGLKKDRAVFAKEISKSHKKLFREGKKTHRGQKNPKWKGGKMIDEFGYEHTYAPNHPNRIQNKYVRTHRLVMEKFLGRYLTKEEVIHHKNGDRLDNRIDNLHLCKNHSEHRFIHIREKQNVC